MFWNDDEDENNNFDFNDLELVDYQYKITHNSTNIFNIGEEVFLKSNPEIKLIVYSINKKEITTIRYIKNEIDLNSFPPQCLLQYKYRGLLKYKNKFNICLN